MHIFKSALHYIKYYKLALNISKKEMLRDISLKWLGCCRP